MITIKDALAIQAEELSQNPTQRAVNALHAIKSLAVYLWAAKQKKVIQEALEAVKRVPA